jgi:capsular exopolysaccharide synthesis family protein
MSIADFWRVYRAAIRRKWLMAAVVGSTMVVVGIGCLVLPRYYRATALVMPSDEALQKSVISRGAPGAQPAYDPQVREERLANLIYLAQSQVVLSRAADSLGLKEPLPKLSRRVEVDALPQTAILRITALDKDRQRSISLVNSMAQTFADFYHELSHREAVSNRVFLERELDSALRDLSAAQNRLAGYRATDGGAGVALDATQDAVSPAEKERDDTEAQLRETSARLEAARSRLAQEQPTVLTEEGTTDNPAVTKLQTDLADLERKLAAQLAIHTDRHPEVIALRAQIDDLRRRLSTEMQRVVKHRTIARNPLYAQLSMQVADLQAGKMALQARLDAMNRMVERERGQYSRASARGVELAALTRDYRIAEDTYRRLKAAVDQARIDEKVTSGTGAIQVVDLARSAQGPVTKGPSPWQLLGLGFLLSVALALGLVVVLDVLDDRIHGTDDLMRQISLPVTGIIPGMAGVTARELPLITHVSPSSPYAEAYRFLRTDLLFTCQDQPLQTLCVVTPKPGQGGTTTISNLAIALAEAERSVILVDGDLRRPSLHRIFGLSNEVGLTTVLADGTALGDALQQTDIPNLRLLAAGPLARNPSNLINSSRMRTLMAELRENADFVLVDTPSAIAFSDAAIIASMTDGALMVVRARQPLRGSQLQVTSLLNKARANIIGAVLNDVAPESVDTFYFHSHYYTPQVPGGEWALQALPAAQPGWDAAPSPERGEAHPETGRGAIPMPSASAGPPDPAEPDAEVASEVDAKFDTDDAGARQAADH